MPEPIEPSASPSRRNPLFWIGLGVVGLVLYLLFAVDRGAPFGEIDIPQVSESAESTGMSGQVDRSVLVPPGMRARKLVEQARIGGVPYPLEEIHQKALGFQNEGSLADAHLLFFFAAREGYRPSMMKMAELSDPTRFEASNSLLDRADAVQSLKWYRKLAALGEPSADERIRKLREWAVQASVLGNPEARQLLLNIR